MTTTLDKPGDYPAYMAGIQERRAQHYVDAIAKGKAILQMRNLVMQHVTAPKDVHRVLQDIVAATKRPDSAFSDALDRFIGEWFYPKGWEPELVQKPYSGSVQHDAQHYADNARRAGAM